MPSVDSWQPVGEDPGVDWRLSGTYFENCNCNVTCPCAVSGFSVPGDDERCVVLLAFHIDSGEIDGVDVSGLSYAVLADAPGAMAEGNWRVGLLMDAAASPEQAQALAGVASGQRGGAPAAFSPFVGELLGMESAEIVFGEDGPRHSVRIGDLADVAIEDFVPRGASEPTRLTGVPHPVSSTLTAARATRSRVRAFGIELDAVGKNGHAAAFSWTA
ncbi:MAG: hypothetical protein QOE10_2129 [Gaiellales bacterium]|nr:hypothetical protein [Gaiellales bacterium]